MNDRIRDIAEHCDFYVGNEHYNESHEEKQRLWVEKFAELIVRAAAQKLENDGMVEVAMELKEYFGVDQ